MGWNLPPGCTQRHIDEAAGMYAICDICGLAVDNCICVECEVCGAIGEPACYEIHALPLSMMQRLNVWIREERDRKVREEEDRLAEEWWINTHAMEGTYCEECGTTPCVLTKDDWK